MSVLKGMKKAAEVMGFRRILRDHGYHVHVDDNYPREVKVELTKRGFEETVAVATGNTEVEASEDLKDVIREQIEKGQLKPLEVLFRERYPEFLDGE